MDEQRLVTLEGGPLDGRLEAWEAGQTERRAFAGFTTNGIGSVMPWRLFAGVYRERQAGLAEFFPTEGFRDPLRDLPSSNDVLRFGGIDALPRPGFWKRYFG